jgi:hypothetical protein
MDEQGIDRTLMFPTLASLVEARMSDAPELIHVVIHALNEWMYETWRFDYEGRIFSTPVITMPIVEEAVREVEWAAERGAKVVLVRPRHAGHPRSLGPPSSTPSGEDRGAGLLITPLVGQRAVNSEMDRPGRRFQPS